MASTIWQVVYDDEDADDSPVGLFSTREMAELFRAAMERRYFPSHYRIEPTELDPDPPSIPVMNSTGDIENASENELLAWLRDNGFTVDMKFHPTWTASVMNHNYRVYSLAPPLLGEAGNVIHNAGEPLPAIRTLALFVFWAIIGGALKPSGGECQSPPTS